MNAKKRILGGAILTALAGTGAYFCSNNDDKLQTSYEETPIEQSIRAEQSEQDFLDIIAKPYRPEKDTILEDIIQENPLIKTESIDEKIKRLSDLFEENYKQSITIQRDYDSKNHDGKIINADRTEWNYKWKDGKIEIIFNSDMAVKLRYDYVNEKVDIRRVYLFEKGKDFLVIKKDKDHIVAYTHEKLMSDKKSEKKIENLEDIRGFTIWEDIIYDIIRRHK